MSEILDTAKFGSDGLIPAVVQDARTREVLTVAYMNKEALQLTLEKRETYFWKTENLVLKFRSHSKHQIELLYISYPVIKMMKTDKNQKVDDIANDF